MPTAPLRSDEAQKNLVCALRPLMGDQQGDIAAFDIDRTVENPLGPMARDGHIHRLAIAPIGSI
jgi:hypothetical protein